MKTFKITAQIQSMGDAEILNMIPYAVYSNIKTKEEKPEFRAYVIGEEGDANQREIENGAKVTKIFRWAKDLIVKISEKIQFSAPLWYRHNKDNSPAGREQIGEVVGKGVKFIKDKLSAVMIAYIYPQHRNKVLDIASIEGVIEYVPKTNTTADVLDVQEISGVALSNSRIENPAFKNATLLGAVQAFAGKGENMEKGEVLEAIKALKLKVVDVFSEEDIANSEPAKMLRQSYVEEAKRVKAELGKERENLVTVTKERDEHSLKARDLMTKLNSITIKTLFDTEAGIRKFTEPQKGFISKNLPSFKSDKEGDVLKAEFGIFLNNQITEFNDTAKIMGIKVEETNKQAPATDGKGDGSNMQDPAQNDAIPS